MTFGKRSVISKDTSIMNDNLNRREHEAARSRRASAAFELGANVSLQDGEAVEAHTASQSYSGLDRLNVSGWRVERSNLATQNSHQRHMPMEPLKLPIPRKTKEKKGRDVLWKSVNMFQLCVYLKCNIFLHLTCLKFVGPFILREYVLAVMLQLTKLLVNCYRLEWVDFDKLRQRC